MINIEFIKNLTADKNTNLVYVVSEKTIANLDLIAQEQLVDFGIVPSEEGCVSFTCFSGYKSVTVFNVGKEDEISESELVDLGGKIATALSKEKNIVLDIKLSNIDLAVQSILLGAKLKSYHFDKYISNDKDKKTYKIETIKCLNNAIDLQSLEAVSEGIILARGLVSEPSNVLYPETYKDIIKSLEKDGLEVTVIDKKEAEKLGMGSFLSVSYGSDKAPYVVVMKYNGAKDKSAQPVAFVGKGVTFDTGGYSLKGALPMIGMKKDMGGSATVVGLMKTLAKRKANVNAVGVVGLVENCVNGSATKPQDIVTAMNGKTIEVLNTDAEGRLVLADILWYTQDKFKPKFMVNLATLTGAIIMSLGWERAGLFSNNDDLANQIKNSADKTGELVWHMPISKEYAKYLKSPVADYQNISLQANPGSIFAAMFLKEFVNDVPWAHLDIAGTASAASDLAICQKGATGWGIRLLNDVVKNHYEG